MKPRATGTLKSLHIFMDMAPHILAVRFYAGGLKITGAEIATGKKYYLLNLPYYLATQLTFYLSWFQQQIQK